MPLPALISLGRADLVGRGDAKQFRVVLFRRLGYL